jgi:hypothetical protein
MKILVATLALVLSLSSAAIALSSTDVSRSRGPQGLPGAGPSPSSVPESSAALPRSRGPQGLPGPGPSPAPQAKSRDLAIPSSGGGLNVLAIVLICIGAVLALAGVAYSATVVVQHRRALS